jgi:transposase
VKEHDWTRVLGWPGYKVYRMEVDEPGKKLKLWVRRKKTGLKLICSRCGQHVSAALIHEVCEREVRDLPCFEYTTTVVVETYRVRCPRCGIRAEKVAQLPSKAPYSKRFERRQPPLRQMGVDEIYRGKKGKFLTVVCNLETAEPLWFGRERKKETLDDFFRSQLVSRQRRRIEAACVDMWEPFRLSIQEWAPQCQIIYDKFHIMQHANEAIDEVRKAEYYRQGPKKRGLIKGKKWLLLSRWKNLTLQHRGELNRLFQLNRRVFKAYLLKESLERLWNYSYRGAMLNYLNKWMEQLKWQRLVAFEKLAATLLKHVDGIANYCETKVRFGVVEAVNGNIRMLINRGRGYQNLRYMLLKAKRMAVTNVEFIAVHKAKEAA